MALFDYLTGKGLPKEEVEFFWQIANAAYKGEPLPNGNWTPLAAGSLDIPLSTASAGLGASLLSSFGVAGQVLTGINFQSVFGSFPGTLVPGLAQAAFDATYFDGIYYDSPASIGSQALALVNPTERIIAISFRGTDFSAGGSSLAADIADYFTIANTTGVFGGSYTEEFRPLLTAVANYYDKLPDKSLYEIYIAGHSLGGAAANQLRDQAAQFGDIYKNAIYVTFGSPTIASNPDILNIGHENDGVFRLSERQQLFTVSQQEKTFQSTTDNLVYYDPEYPGYTNNGFGALDAYAHFMPTYNDTIARILSSQFYDKITDPDSTIIIDATDAVVSDVAARSAQGHTAPRFFMGQDRADGIVGADGEDYIEGRDGDDTLSGLGGDDHILGGPGADRLTLGAGSDILLYTDRTEGVDTIPDFAPGTDRFDFSAIFTPAQGAAWTRYVALTGQTDGTLVSIDPSGAGGAFTDMALLQGVRPDQLKAADFGLPEGPPPVGTFSIAPAAATVGEKAGTVSFTVTRSDASAAQTVYVSTVQDKGSVNNGDYVGKLNEALTFAAGDLSEPVIVTILDDTIREDNETFDLIVQKAATDPITDYLAAATFTIADDDAVPPSAVQSIVRVSTDKDGNQGNGTSWGTVHFFPDGSKVAFVSSDSNLVDGDTNGAPDIFVKDFTSGAITLISTSANGIPSYNPFLRVFSISRDGSKVAFESYPTDIFLKDLTTGETTLISGTVDGLRGNFASYEPMFSPDGTKVGFSSAASNLVPDDGNNNADIFVKALFSKPMHHGRLC